VPTRRNFLKTSALACASCALSGTPGSPRPAQQKDVPSPAPVEARYWDKMEDRKVTCRLCPRECVVADRERGYCGVRENRDGVYYTLVHSNVCAEHVDPVEKKPLFHFLPGTTAYSIATAGCNIECKFCQNWEISQFRPEQVRSARRTPKEVANIAGKFECRSIAYTYTEPVIFTEFMYDCSKAGRQKGIRSIMISNGYIQEKPMEDLTTVLDAVKIDLKAFTNKFYRKMCNGTLKPVLDTLRLLRKSGIWFEIVVLIIPFKNDSQEEIKAMCDWIVENLGDSVPLHFSRFFPTYKIKDLPVTPLETLERAWETAKKAGLHFSYIGNVPGHEAENTLCPNCHKVIIERTGFFVRSNKIGSGHCAFCSEKIPGVWK